MDKKRILASVVVFLILAVLVYLQYRHWRTFDWGTFWSQTHRVKKIHVVHGVALIYLGYLLRALRWKIFLNPVRPKTRTMDLVSPTLVGFTGLALLGRAGEFIRPYLIARRTDLPVSSQIAVWGVERTFDIGAFTVLMMLAIFFVLLVLWALGFFAFHVAGGLIHLLLIIAVISLVVHLFSARTV